MGNSSSNESNCCCCCCNRKSQCFYFEIEDKDINHCNIILIANHEVNNEEDTKANYFKNVLKDEDLTEFLKIINKIIKNFELIPKEKLFEILNSLKVLSKDKIDFYLNLINNLQEKGLDKNFVDEFVSLFKFIYDRKDEIKKENINSFITKISHLFQKKEVLNEEENTFLIEKLNKLYFPKNSIGKNNFIKYEDNSCDNANTGKEILNEIKSVKSSTFSNYSKNSQHTIIKLEEKIKEMEKSNMILTFLDEEEKEYFTLHIYLKENDIFSTVMEKFYEKYPEYKEKNIKFSINGKQIKISESIKKLNLSWPSTIIIENSNGR